MISSAGRRQKKKSRRRADTFSRAYETAALIFRAAVSLFTQTYDEFSGNIVANSDLNCCICLKIKIFLMSLPHLPTSVDFHQDITLHIQEGHQ